MSDLVILIFVLLGIILGIALDLVPAWVGVLIGFVGSILLAWKIGEAIT